MEASVSGNDSDEQEKIKCNPMKKVSVKVAEFVARKSPLIETGALLGARAFLPCDCRPPITGDSPILVLFYNGKTGAPIFSVDARETKFEAAPQWSEERVFGSRTSFETQRDKQGLYINDVTLKDEGDYLCRVDFLASATRNVRIKLQVVIPPRRILIKNESGETVSKSIGPYSLGSNVKLSCEVEGGRPPPMVSWWQGRDMVDDMVEFRSDDVTKNLLLLPNLTQQHLYRTFACKAISLNNTPEISSSVTLDMSFPPSFVRIKWSGIPLVEGRQSALECESIGSRPEAFITWWKDGVLLMNSKSLVLQDGNVTRSSITLVPARDDNGVVVSCKAENYLIPDMPKFDRRILVVHYAPRLSLRLGHGLTTAEVDENSDFYFECVIDANPAVTRIQWLLNGEPLYQDVNAGIIQSNQSLVLQKVDRKSAGTYSCLAMNFVGDAKSNEITFIVKYKPVCSEGQKIVYGGGRNQPVNVTCSVNAFPEAAKFQWAFNTTAEIVDINHSQTESRENLSVFGFTPLSQIDYGSLLCWATNQMGKQILPCVFHVIPATTPESVWNCSIWHNTSIPGKASITCRSGWDGGLKQLFTLTVKAKDRNVVLASLQNQSTPNFNITGLSPGKDYIFSITSLNPQGTGPTISLSYSTPIDIAEERLSAATSAGGSLGSSFLSTGSILGILLGAAMSFILCFSAAIALRNRGNSRKGLIKSMSYKSHSPTTEIDKELGPDIILINADGHSHTEDLSEEENNKLLQTKLEEQRSTSHDSDKGSAQAPICHSSTSIPIIRCEGLQSSSLTLSKESRRKSPMLSRILSTQRESAV